MSNITLGNSVNYPDQYDPGLLSPISRGNARNALFPAGQVPFTGVDIWTAYEVSWLNSRGKPQVAIAEFEFAADTPKIIESKSFKYYLNSLNNTSFESCSGVATTLERDLNKACGAQVGVSLFPITQRQEIETLPGTCVDNIDTEISQYLPDVGLLQVLDKPVLTDRLYSHLLKSNCPVSGQPDWASVWIEYSGKQIVRESFLRYIVSFRNYQDFHEHCVEKIFRDILEKCTPDALSVYARYTRRGGLDINPFRTNCDRLVPVKRLIRQ